MIYGNKILYANDIDYIEEISAEKLCNLLQLNGSEIITEQVIEESAASVLMQTGSIVENLGINKKIFEQACAKCVKDVFNIVKKNGSGKNVKEKVQNCFSEMNSAIKESFDEAKFKSRPIYQKINANDIDSEKIKKACVLFAVTVAINSISCAILRLLCSAFMGLMGIAAADTITAVIIAPISEETAKHIAVSGGFAVEFTVLFNILEFSQYMLKLFPAALFRHGGLSSIGRYAVVRLTTVGMHVTNTLIIKGFAIVADKLKLEGNKREAFITCGQVITMIIHASWNAIGGTATVNDKLVSWITAPMEK